jgi:hypothetical protein
MTVAFLAAWTWGRNLLGMGVGAEQWENGASVLLGLVGWTAGLMISGFPSVLRASVERSPPPQLGVSTARPSPRWLQRLALGPSAPARARRHGAAPGAGFTG